jgi:polygalacturonase
MLRRDLFSLPALALGFAVQSSASSEVLPRTINILDYGAQADGQTKNTSAIQKAIDSAHANGGGIVYFPPGIFVTGGLVLRSRVTLYLEAGSILRGSTDLQDYKYHGGPPEEGDANGRHLIFARDAEDIVITGFGTIDGQGEKFWSRTERATPAANEMWQDVVAFDWRTATPSRPSPMLEFVNCKNLHLENILITNAAGWTVRPIGCDSVFIRGIRIRNPIYGPNTDGLDITASKNVFVSDCDIACGDDAICIKSENPYGEVLPTKNITITNCVLTTCCNGFKLGSATHGGFENIVFSNSVIYNDQEQLNQRVIAGIAIEMVDGGYIDGVSISNIRMQNTRTPIFIRLGRRTPSPASFLRNVRIQGIDASGSLLTSSISGLPDLRPQDVSLDNIRIRTVEGGKSSWDSAAIPECERNYPEARMFGRLPAYGFYIRHADQIHLSNVELISDTPDERPAIVCDDVRNLSLEALKGSASHSDAFVALHNTRKAFLHGSIAPDETRTFVRIGGNQSSGITLGTNDLSQASQSIAYVDGATEKAVTNGTGAAN